MGEFVESHKSKTKETKSTSTAPKKKKVAFVEDDEEIGIALDLDTQRITAVKNKISKVP